MPRRSVHDICARPQTLDYTDTYRALQTPPIPLNHQLSTLYHPAARRWVAADLGPDYISWNLIDFEFLENSQLPDSPYFREPYPSFMSQLSHFDESGASRMVDVGAKDITHRMARAAGVVTMQAATLQLIRDRKLAKGDVFEVARLAGIMATKRTADLIPLCHPLGLDNAEVSFEIESDCTIRIEARVAVHGRTGVEMEAMTAVCVAALTVYDMCKSIDRGMTIGPIQLIEKSGGKSGHYTARGVDAS